MTKKRAPFLHDEGNIMNSKERKAPARKEWGVIAAIVVVALLSATVAACTSKSAASSTSAPKDAPQGIVEPAAWADAYPYQAETYAMGEEDKETVDYLEEYPFLTTIYDGSAFAKSYDSARAHNYALEDVKATPRISEKSKATCYSCKSAQYTQMEEEQGASLYKTSFDELRDTMTVGITCYDCHKDSLSSEGGPQLLSIRSHFNNAFGDLVERGRVSDSTSTCAQCHNEYYFKPDTGAVALPQHLTTPDDILAFYNSIDFTDYTNPVTGVKQLKAQHPEFQTYATSMHSTSGLSCADCHMEKTEKDGKIVTSHNVVSPLESDSIMKNTCLTCHAGETKDSLTKRVKDIQGGVEEKTVAGGEMLKDLTTKLAAAQSSGQYTSDELAQVRSLNRDAQWYWDWVFVENSDGFHNPKQAHASLDTAASLTTQALDILSK